MVSKLGYNGKEKGMSIWRYLFDSDYLRKLDIEGLQDRANAAGESVGQLKKQVEYQQKKLDAMELLLESLIGYLKAKGLLRKKELALLVQRVDLGDGYEDGKMGPDRTAKAPACPFCHRPFNPKRPACIYCGQVVSEKDLALMADSPRKVRCVGCYSEVAENNAHLTTIGLLCPRCFGLK
jgi:hypothetical protein